jgi:hypothetical protein
MSMSFYHLRSIASHRCGFLHAERDAAITLAPFVGIACIVSFSRLPGMAIKMHVLFLPTASCTLCL